MLKDAVLRARSAWFLRRHRDAPNKPVPNGLPAPAKPQDIPPPAPKTYTVADLDMWDFPEQGCIRYTDGFPSLEVAREYARRSTWDSVEEQRPLAKSRNDLRTRWLIYGHSCSVVDDTYSARDDLDYFLDHPAAPWQRDYGALDPTNDVSTKGAKDT